MCYNTGWSHFWADNMRTRDTNTLARRRRLGGSSVEYLLILAVIVIPLAIVIFPMGMKMIVTYTNRVAQAIRLPFG